MWKAEAVIGRDRESPEPGRAVLSKVLKKANTFCIFFSAHIYYLFRNVFFPQALSEAVVKRAGCVG